MIDRIYLLIFYFDPRSFTMMLSLTLELILLLVKSINSEECEEPARVQIHQMGPISTISCLQSKLGIKYNKITKNLTKSAFYRVMCSDDLTYVGLDEKNDNLFFCTDNSCTFENSTNLFLNYKLYFNSSVIKDFKDEQVFNCYDAQWWSLLGGELPVELKNSISKSTPAKYVTIHSGSRMKTRFRMVMDNTDESELKIVDEDHFKNVSKLKVRYSREPLSSSVDLCLIAIIFTIVCSILFIITIVLLISSRIFLRQQIKRKLMTPLGNISVPQPFLIKAGNDKVVVPQDQYVIVSQLTSSVEVRNCKSLTTSDIESRYHQ